MRALAIPLILAAASTTASAGDLRIDLGFRVEGVRVDLGFHRGHARPACTPQRVWRPGFYETVETRVYVPASTTQVYEPALYEWRLDRCGHRVRVCVRPAGYRTVCVPAHYETRTEQVWRPGHWETVYTCGCDSHRHAQAAPPVRHAERHYDRARHGRHDHDRGRRDRRHD